MRRIFLDLDGVMADFDAAFEREFNRPAASLVDDEMWARIHSLPAFFRDLPPMPGALNYYQDYLRHFDPIVLTACPKSDYAHVSRQKMGWVREHLATDALVITTPGGSTKPLFMQNPGDILIDDFERNTKAWEKAGGVAILHTGDWSATHRALDAALRL